MLGSMTLRALLLVLAMLGSLAACGTASGPSPSSGVDELTVPTPSPDPADFVEGVDNPWLPLAPGRTWTYQVVDVRGEHLLTVTVAEGPDVAGVPTTARVSVEEGVTTTDWFAQDDDGNVWWLGREGEWRAGEAGAQAGLAMPRTPRVGDGYRAAYLPGVVEDVVTVEARDRTVTVPAGTYDGLLATEWRSALQPATIRREYAARGTGLVEATQAGRTVRLQSVSG